MKDNKDEILTRKLEHILNIIEERMWLYKKRQLEIKRSVKAHHRAELSLDHIILLNLLEAVISYCINLAAVKALRNQLVDNTEKQFTTINAFLFSNEKLWNDFISQIRNEKVALHSLDLSAEEMKALFSTVLSLDEDFQRKKIYQIIASHTVELVQNIFKEITILDTDFRNKTINKFKQYLLEKTNH